MKRPQLPEQVLLLPFLGKWCALALVVALLAGSASALFLWALDGATAWRLDHPWMIALLPCAGFAVGWLYLRLGSSVEAGNNLLIDEINHPRQVIPLRMAPLVLGATVISHLFGASVGREGTAVQMGGALADQLSLVFRIPQHQRRLLLMAGISAGFASVFGTPLAGALFGMEVLAIGSMRYDAILPCAIAAVVADQVSMLWGVHHTYYPHLLLLPVSGWSLLAALLAGLLFGLIGMGFARASHALAARMKRHIAYPPLRPFIGGAVIALAVAMLGTQRYIGLGMPTIVQAFEQPLPAWDFVGKLGFTIVSLGSGFKGGEVTPLFYIGATLGNALAPLLHQPFALLAALGFVAVFAGAANTPIACTVMALELFGPAIGPYAALACIAAYLMSGNVGIYRSQKVVHAKHQDADLM